jgi:hypothetical protein
VIADKSVGMPSDPRDYKLELTTQSATPERTSRPFLSVHFACCNIYLRLYRAAGAAGYAGQCPRCGKSVRFPIGAGGTSLRAFRVY